MDALATSPNVTDHPPEPPPKRRRRWADGAISVAIIALAAGLAYLLATNWNAWVGGRRLQSTDDAYIAADVRPLNAHVAGYVESVPVDDFQRVKAGETIVTIVDADYRAKLREAKANLAAAQSALVTLNNQIVVQQANVRAARATAGITEAALHRDLLEAKRQRTLLKRGLAGTRQKVEEADAALQQDEATLSRDQANVNAASAQVAMLQSELLRQQAVINATKAATELARIDFHYTKIVAPADGMIARRLVQPGQYVNVGTQVTSFVPLPMVWVIANYRETQMTRVRRGQSARIAVDAFPGVTLTGHVDGWSPASGAVFSLLPPDNATGNFTKVVQRIPVKIVIDGAGKIGDLLRPGMSVVATIDTAAAGAGAANAEPTKP